MRNGGSQIKIGDKEFKLFDLDTRKNEINKELKNIEYNDLEDMVYMLDLTDTEILRELEMRYFYQSTTGYTLEPGKYENIDINLMLKSLLPNEGKVIITVDDVRLQSI